MYFCHRPDVAPYCFLNCRIKIPQMSPQSTYLVSALYIFGLSDDWCECPVVMKSCHSSASADVMVMQAPTARICVQILEVVNSAKRTLVMQHSGLWLSCQAHGFGFLHGKDSNLHCSSLRLGVTVASHPVLVMAQLESETDPTQGRQIADITSWRITCTEDENRESRICCVPCGAISSSSDERLQSLPHIELT